MSAEIPDLIMMMRHYLDLGSAFDWSCCVGNLLQTIRSATQIWVVTRRQYGISRSFLRRRKMSLKLTLRPFDFIEKVGCKLFVIVNFHLQRHYPPGDQSLKKQ